MNIIDVFVIIAIIAVNSLIMTATALLFVKYAIKIVKESSREEDYKSDTPRSDVYSDSYEPEDYEDSTENEQNEPQTHEDGETILPEAELIAARESFNKLMR